MVQKDPPLMKRADNIRKARPYDNREKKKKRKPRNQPTGEIRSKARAREITLLIGTLAGCGQEMKM